MLEKDYSISFCRMIALILIISCHVLQYYNNSLCWWFNVGVQIFLIISGFLYSKKVIKDVRAFYTHNLVKIFGRYLIYIIAALFLYCIFAEQSIKNMFLQFFLIKNIAGLGHLWFIPTILFCYFITPNLIDILNSIESRKKYIFFKYLMFLIVLGYFMILFAKPVTAWILCYVLGMIIKRIEQRIKLWHVACVAFISIVLVLICEFSFDFLQTYHVENYVNEMAHTLLGVSIFTILRITYMKLLKDIKIAKNLLNYSDMYSYSIYLCHHLLILRTIISF